jgi:hypothetical protein
LSKTIGIFGDSSAVPNKKFNHSWIELLSAKKSFDNFSAEGASLVFVYDQLLKYGKNYDEVIIFIPPVGRLWVPNYKYQHFVNHLTAHMLLNNGLNSDEKILTSVKDYFINLWHYSRESLVQRALVDSINIMFPKALIIPVTPDGVYYNDRCMHYISLLDNEYYDVHEYKPDWGRTCHMNKENNEIFYRKILNWLDNKTFVLDVKDFKYPAESKEELFPNENN